MQLLGARGAREVVGLAGSAAVAIVGATVGILLAASTQQRIGPFDATLRVRPALHGATVVHLAPLGSIELDTHDGPIRLDARVDELRVAEARRLAADPTAIAEIDGDVTADARHALRVLLLRTAVAAMVGATAAGLLWRQTWRGGIVSAAIGVALVMVVAGTVAVTRNDDALAEPKYTGLLTFAPQAVGDVEEVLGRFSAHRAELGTLVGNVARLYQTAQGLDSNVATGSAIRVLHVSDIHLNPEAFDVMRQVTKQFKVDAIVDTGDLNDWGTTVEAPFAGQIASLGVPYVFIRGNHDSAATEAAVAAQPNAVVLDDRETSVAGLRIWGIGDPRYTPDQSATNDPAEQREAIRAFALAVAQRVGTLPATPDVVLVHDPGSADGLAETVPLVLAGHKHRFAETHRGSTVLLTEGSTGGAGLRSFESDSPPPLSCSVLYFDPATKRLLAYDRITIESVSSSGVRIERRVLPTPSTTTTSTTRPGRNGD
jgi:predicted phosphodiesterase